jgi:hypothetical protein
MAITFFRRSAAGVPTSYLLVGGEKSTGMGN